MHPDRPVLWASGRGSVVSVHEIIDGTILKYLPWLEERGDVVGSTTIQRCVDRPVPPPSTIWQPSIEMLGIARAEPDAVAGLRGLPGAFRTPHASWCCSHVQRAVVRPWPEPPDPVEHWWVSFYRMTWPGSATDRPGEHEIRAIVGSLENYHDPEPGSSATRCRTANPLFCRPTSLLQYSRSSVPPVPGVRSGHRPD
jgi:hypothetical protein